MPFEDSSANEDSRELLLGRVAEQYFSALDHGENPSLTEFASRYPEIAAEILNVFPALGLVGRTSADTSLAKRADDFRAPQQLGDYLIIRELGRGGMGVVYEAEQLSLSRRVALKVLPFAAVLDDRQLHRFKNEARAAATLQHDHIVPVYSVGCERGVHFYAMQLIDGQSLADIISALPHRKRANDCIASSSVSSSPRDHASTAGCAYADVTGVGSAKDRSAVNAETARLSASSTIPAFGEREYFRAVARLGCDAARALEHAHQHGIIHRDIKPGNLLLDSAGKLWVTDLGLARIGVDGGLTTTGDIVGTLSYMSPEQALGQAVVDQRTDVYSLGATLYELITRTKAFPTSDRKSLLHKIAFDEPTPPRHVNRRVPLDLDTIIRKAMEKDAADRYVTAQEFADDLKRFVEHRPIRACSPGVLAKAAKWSRRHVGIVWTLLGATLLGMGLLAVSLGLITNSRSALTVALKEAELNGQRLSESLYAADVRLAAQALKDKDPLRGVQLLDRHIPVPGREDYRDLEWHFLNSRFSSSHTVLAETGSPIYDFAFSPSEATLAVVGKDAVLHVFKWPSMERQARIETGQGELNGVAFSDDASIIATVGDNGELRLWQDLNPETRRIVNAHEGVAYDVAYSTPLNCWITCGDDRTIRLFAADGGECVGVFEGHTGGVTSIAVSKDGATLASTGNEHVVRIWDIRTQKQTHHVEPGGRHTNIVFDDRSEILLLGGGSKISNESLIQYDLGRHQYSASWLSTNKVEGLTIAGNRRHIAAAFDGGVILTLEVEDKNLTPIPNAVRMWHGRSGPLRKIEFTQDCSQLVSAGDDGILRTWSDFEHKELAQKYRPFEGLGPIDRVGCKPFVVVAGTSGLEVVDVRTGERIRAIEGPELKEIDVSPDGSLVAASTESGDVFVWSLLNERAAPLITKKGSPPTENVSLSPDNSTLAMWGASAETELRLLNLRSGVERTGFLPDGCHQFEWSPDGSYFVAAEYRSDDVIVYEAATGMERWRGTGHGSTIFPLAVSPDSRLIASADDERNMIVWDAVTGKKVWSTTLPSAADLRSYPRAIEFTSSGRTLLVQDSVGQLTTWHVASGRELVKIDGEKGVCHSMTTCCNGRYICMTKNAGLQVIDTEWTSAE